MIEMITDPLHLLRKLEPPVRPAAAPPHRGAEVPASLERLDFDQLLALAASGRVHSGRPVTVAPGADLLQPLEGAQLERLAAAADVAEAAGSRRAVMLMDGRGLVMDVAGRVVADELTGASARQLHSVDAAVYVAGDGDETTNEDRAA